jgi:serine/threonine-protein kinase
LGIPPSLSKLTRPKVWCHEQRLLYNAGNWGESEDFWYGVHQEIGEGGNCVVYLVTQREGIYRGNSFALKVFKNINDETRRERFEEERILLQDVDHPSILRYYDQGNYHGYPFLVSEYLPRTLREVMRERDLNLTEKISYSVQLLSVLRFLESREPAVVHRDIKPENIFVRGNTCYLGDFGLIKRLGYEDANVGETISQSKDIAMNKKQYRTPGLVEYERGNIEDVPIVSDVFQLGLVLIELFTDNNWNPQIARDNPLSDVIIDDNAYKYIDIKEGLGSEIATLLVEMINPNYKERKKASTLIDHWVGIFEDSTKMSYDINGHIFRGEKSK